MKTSLVKDTPFPSSSTACTFLSSGNPLYHVTAPRPVHSVLRGTLAGPLSRRTTHNFIQSWRPLPLFFYSLSKRSFVCSIPFMTKSSHPDETLRLHETVRTGFTKLNVAEAPQLTETMSLGSPRPSNKGSSSQYHGGTGSRPGIPVWVHSRKQLPNGTPRCQQERHHPPHTQHPLVLSRFRPTPAALPHAYGQVDVCDAVNHAV